MGCPRCLELNRTFPTTTTTDSGMRTSPASPGAQRGHFGFISRFFSIHKGGRFPSLCLLFIFWVSLGMGSVALQESPSAGRQNTALSNAPGSSGKARGAGTPGAPGFALGVGKKEINTNAGNDPFGWTFRRACGAALGHPRLLPSRHPWNPLDPRLAEGFGLGLGWVFTVTTKARLCGTFLGEELGMEELNPPLALPEGITELCTAWDAA